MYKNLVLSGGSVKVIGIIGILQELESKNLINLSQLESIAGCSGGAIMALFLNLNFKLKDIQKLIYSIDFNKLIDLDFLQFTKAIGLTDGEKIKAFLEKITKSRTGISNITFQQLYEITNRELIIVGSCLTDKQCVYFSYKTHPAFHVIDAVRISISIPLFFTPVVIDNKTYVDGGMMNNYPIDLYDHDLERTIGINVCNDYKTDYDYPEEYIAAILNLCMYNYFKKPGYAKNTIDFECTLNNISSTYNFDISPKIVDTYIQAGIESAQRFINFNNHNY